MDSKIVELANELWKTKAMQTCEEATEKKFVHQDVYAYIICKKREVVRIFLAVPEDHCACKLDSVEFHKVFRRIKYRDGNVFWWKYFSTDVKEDEYMGDLMMEIDTMKALSVIEKAGKIVNGN